MGQSASRGLISRSSSNGHIITELGSILENAVRMGANIPAWLVKLLKASANIVEAAGDLTVSEEVENNRKLNE